ncbi:MAG: hypothetical protein AB7L92_05990 [Alphaproteobacteria bacterium]
MVKPDHPEPLKEDAALIAELTAAIILLGPDSRTCKFYSAVARPHNFDAKKASKQAETPSPQEVATALARFYDERLKHLDIPDDPKKVTVELEQQLLQSLSPEENMALKIASGWEPNMSRRSFFGGMGMAIGAAFLASGATCAVTMNTGRDRSTADSSPGSATNVVTPDPAILLSAAGAILMLASVMKQMQKRKGNPTTGRAQTEQPLTIAEIMVESENKINESLRMAQARREKGPGHSL